MPRLELISHLLCPYVQRAAIVLEEKRAPFTRIDVDLANKPDWFLAISPLGKTPLLRVDGDAVLFESTVICEYLDEVIPPRLLPGDPLPRARARGWVEMASAILANIWGYYTAPDEAAFLRNAGDLRAKFAQVERALAEGPWFDGARFGLPDAAFGPVFRYFDVIDRVVANSVLRGLPSVAAWRGALADRPSVAGAVAADYPERLAAFIVGRGSYLGQLLAARAA